MAPFIKLAVFAVFASVQAAAQPLLPVADRPAEDDIVYFVMLDRFADGDPENNTGGYDGGADAHGYDPSHKGFYHGGDIKGLISKLDYLEGLGVTALWLAPIFKNRPVQGPKGVRSAGYHGYWITDFTDVDPHLGDRGDFAALMSAAHARGMKVFLDIVTNHTADVIWYRECEDAPDCPYRSKALFPYITDGGPQGPAINEGFLGDAMAVQTAANFARLTDPSYAYTPFVPEGLEGAKSPAWLNAPIYYHNRGNSTFEGESSRLGDFAGLDDLFTENPRVVAGMAEIYKDWIADFRIDGFRIDTAKHVNDGFWQRFLPQIEAQAADAQMPNFYMFGEVYSFDPAFLSRFTRQVAFPAVLDFAFQGAVRAAVAEAAPTAVLADLFADDDYYAGAGAARLPTFLGNHDMGRFGHFLLQALGEDVSDAELLERLELAHALLFFTRGVPVLYYGGEQGFTGDGGDQDAREDMFESRVASYNDNRLIGTPTSTAESNFDPAHPLYESIAAMTRVLRAERGLRRGVQLPRHAEKSVGIFAVSRLDWDRRREYLLVLNTARDARRADLSVAAADGAWELLIGAGPASLRSQDRRLGLDMPGLSFAVYRAARPVPPASEPPEIAFRQIAGEADIAIEKLAFLPLAVKADDPVRVHFTVRRADGRTIFETRDSAPPYRLIVDPTLFPKQTLLTAQAVAESIGGATGRAMTHFVVTAD